MKNWKRTKKCSWPKGCDRFLDAQGYCLMHYKRLRKNGTLKKREVSNGCAVDECDGEFFAKRFCRLHYRRLLQFGDPKAKLTKFIRRGATLGHPLRLMFFGMIARCTKPGHVAYPHYGGRGIKVCEEWLGEGGFKRFVAHVGERPSENHTLDRIDNDGDYEPGNVRWSTRKEQRRNRRPDRYKHPRFKIVRLGLAEQERALKK